MFKAARHEKIKEILLNQKQINVQTLSSWLNVSPVTIRSDFEELEKQGFLVRTHGGAILKEEPAAEQEDAGGAQGESGEIPVIPALDFTLTDQYGETHTLSDYQGQTVFLNFWATWCGPCKMEMPDIQALYEEWDENAGDLVVLGVAGPGIGREGSAEDIAAFLEANGYTYPVVMDDTGTLFYQYGISAYPTTFMIDPEGNVFGYVQGAVSREIMDDIVEQTMTGQRR